MTDENQGTPPIVADYFTDVLCVWAYAGQVRIDELKRNFNEEVVIRYRFLPLFGDVHGRMQRDWDERGGLLAYAAHVQELAQQWDHAHIHPKTWRHQVPASSCGAHRFIKAVELWLEHQQPGTSRQNASVLESVIWQLRCQFFEEAEDVASCKLQDALATDAGLDASAIRKLADNGKAEAALVSDLELRDTYQVPGSPTLVLNKGRQRLYGDIGYRVLDANIRELLRNPQAGEASWCR